MSFEARKEEINEFLNDNSIIREIIEIMYKYYNLDPTEDSIGKTINATAFVLSLAENGRQNPIILEPSNLIIIQALELCLISDETGINIHSAYQRISNILFKLEQDDRQVDHKKLETLLSTVEFPT